MSYISTANCGTGLGDCGCGGTCGGGPLGLGATPQQNWFNTITQYRYYHPYSTREQERIANRWYYGPGGAPGVAGLGLFDSMDFTSWGLPEWGMVAVGAYLVLSLAGDTRRGVRRVSKFRRKRAA